MIVIAMLDGWVWAKRLQGGELGTYAAECLQRADDPPPPVEVAAQEVPGIETMPKLPRAPLTEPQF